MKNGKKKKVEIATLVSLRPWHTPACQVFGPTLLTIIYAFSLLRLHTRSARMDTRIVYKILTIYIYLCIYGLYGFIIIV